MVFVDPTGEQSEGLGEAARRERERRERLTEAGQTATVQGTNLGEGEGSRAGQPKPSNLLEMPAERQREIDQWMAEARQRREREPQVVAEEEEPSLIEKGLAIVGYIPSKAQEFAEEEAGKRLRSVLVKPKEVDPQQEKEIEAFRETFPHLYGEREQAENLFQKERAGKVPGSVAEHGAYGAGLAAEQGAAYAQAVVVGGIVKRVPNPFGKLGSPAHRAKVASVRADIEARGLIAEAEAPIRTVNGSKTVRYMDVVARDPVTREIVEVHQVGRVTKSNPSVPVARERGALRDVRHSPELRGAKRVFHDY